MSTNLDITNVVTISVASPQAGLANYKVNNLLILTKETPLVTITDYSTYLSPSAVATDFGTGSEAYALATLIFSQSPNILAGGGMLIIAPQGSSETLADAIARVSALVFFGGVLWSGYAPAKAEVLAASAVVQASRRLLFAPSNLASDLQAGGLFADVTAAKFTQTRSLLYTTSAADARKFAAAYASRLMSTNFEGSATTSTMHMKDLAGITADGGITQTILTSCSTVGVDVCAQIAGLTKVFSYGANGFSDDVFNLEWLFYSLQVAGFNAIATTSTKLPQTEPGVAVLKDAYIQVLNQAVNNGFVAPGSWNSTELFGDPVSLIKNVAQSGFYIYSQPVNQQSQADRAARRAPLIQIAVKYAGAIHSTSVIVNVNQ
jgi:hypothetical protein